MKIEHCCERMDFFLKEEKVDIFYYKRWREYAIGMKNGTSAVQIIHFCPWCAAKLPESVSDKWFDILESEHGIDTSTGAEKERIPEEFRTDEWWKKRGL